MVKRTEVLDSLIKDLQAASADIEATALVSSDGLVMASSLPAGVEEDRVAAMSAAMLALGDRAAGALGRGKLEEVFIKGDEGYVVLMHAGTDSVLTVMAREDAKLGLIFLDMQRTAKEIEEVI